METTETKIGIETEEKGSGATRELLERSRQFREEMIALAASAREAFRVIRKTSSGERNEVLLTLARMLQEAKSQEEILQANSQDLEQARQSGLGPAMQDRLTLNPDRIQSMVRALEEIAAFPDPVGEILSGGNLANGIRLIKKRVPLGVVFTVFESRPNVTIDIGALCVKSGNAAILRGGREARHTNRALHLLFERALQECGLPATTVNLVTETDRACMVALLKLNGLIDLVVPRGGEGLIRFVSEHSTIPVVKHDKGVCNLYVDRSADYEKALRVTVNAKLQRPSVCNAIENLIIARDYREAGPLLSDLLEAGIDLCGCEESRALQPRIREITDPETEYATEYLDNRLAVKMVAGLDEAVEFIHRFGSGHSEAIIAENQETIDRFVSAVDSAALFVNCSTRFHDGGQMGMGAEVGISTQRLHVRGPMGIRDLTTTTYILSGQGQIRE